MPVSFPRNTPVGPNAAAELLKQEEGLGENYRNLLEFKSNQ